MSETPVRPAEWHHTAHIDPTARVSAWVDIGAGAVIGARVNIGARVVIGADRDYEGSAARWRARYPGVPVIPHLDAQIAARIAASPDAFNMEAWHCGSTHGRAGHAIDLAGEAGYALEAECGSAVAGGRIYRVSTGRWPHFYTRTDIASADIQAWADRDPLPPPDAA